MPFHNPIPDPVSDQAKKNDRSGGIETLMQAEKLTQIAVLLPSAAFVGWLAGAWLDSKLHQSWIALAGIAFGGISGLIYVVRLVISTGDGGAGKRETGPAADETKGSGGSKP